MNCEISLCTRLAKYCIRRIKTGETLHVCSAHDNYVGIENLELLGEDHLTAVAINKSIKAFEGDEAAR